MHGAVLVQNSDILRFQHIFCNCGYRDLLSVLPELHTRIVQSAGRIFIGFRQADNAFNLDLVVFQPLAVCQHIIAGKADLHIQGRFLHTVGFLVFCDVGDEFLHQLGFITAGCFRELRDNALDLCGVQRGKIHVFRFGVFDNQANDIRGLQGSGGSAASDLLICHNRRGHRVRRQAGGINLVLLQVFEHVGCDLTGLQLGNIRAGGQFLIGADNACHVGGIQSGNIHARGGFGILRHIRQNAFRGQLGCACAFRNLRVFRHKGFHDRLLFFSVLRFGVSSNDRVRSDCTWVTGPFLPACFRPGHIQIRGDLQDFITDSLTEHLVQACQVCIPFIILQELLDRRQLIQRSREVDIREHSLDFFFRHPAVQQGLDLG